VCRSVRAAVRGGVHKMRLASAAAALCFCGGAGTAAAAGSIDSGSAGQQQQQRELQIWLSEPSLNHPSLWSHLMATLARPDRRPYVSTVVPCVFTISGTGELVWNDPDPVNGSEAVLRTFGPRLSQLGFHVVGMIDAGQAGGLDTLVRSVLLTPAKRQAFVGQAVAMVEKYHLDGLNLDVEVGGNSTTGPLYNALVTELAQALRASDARRELSSDICCDCDGDGGDYMGITCQEYAAGPIHSVYTMSTYTNSTADFDKFTTSAVGRLTAAKYGVGMSYNAALTRANMDKLVALGVNKISMWCDVPEIYAVAPYNSFTQKQVEEYWDVLQYFVNSTNTTAPASTAVTPPLRRRPPSAGAATISRGHRILQEKGLQLQAMAFPAVNGSAGFSLDRFAQSNFTGLSFWESRYPTELLGAGSAMQWSRFTTLDNTSQQLSAAELPHLPQMVNMQFYDEPGGATGPDLAQTQAISQWLATQRARYPDVISHTDISGVVSFEAHRVFVDAAQPDMVLSSWYPFSTDPGMPIIGGTPLTLYEKLQTWRQIALRAMPLPVPYGVFTQTIRAGGKFRLPSESELRLNLFAAWTLGYTYTCAFLYGTSGDRALVSALFDGFGDAVRLRWDIYQGACQYCPCVSRG
jgi:hypothetical protein